MLILMAAMLACNCPIERRFWMLTRSGHWFEMVKIVFTDKEWYDNFRVSKETFQNIVSEIEDEIVHKDTRTIFIRAVPNILYKVYQSPFIASSFICDKVCIVCFLISFILYPTF